jgi:hypothetical protein
MIKYLGQSKQDEFVIKTLNYKKNGYFLEIGSNHPININNSYILEKEYNWTGLLVEYDQKYEDLYKLHRTSKYIIKDATTIDYNSLFLQYNFPKNMDYLQIDLEVSNNSTLKTLELLDNTLFKNYTFSVITFEHDIYTGDHYNTRAKSREIFLRNGYVLVFSDVKNSGYPYEDWYVHPNYVNMDFINKIKSDKTMEYSEIISIVDLNM